MAFTAPTVEQFLIRFPRFTDVADEVIAAMLTEAARRVDDTWTEEDFAMGRMLYAAHLLTLDGFGSGAESQAALQGMAGYSSMTSGSLSLTRSADAKFDGSLASTSYGLRFKELLRRNFSGILVARTG